MIVTHGKLAVVLACAGMMVACTSVGISTSLAVDCNTQAALVRQATAEFDKLSPYQRDAINGDIQLSRALCNGTLPSNQVAAMKVVEAANAHIASILGISALAR